MKCLTFLFIINVLEFLVESVGCYKDVGYIDGVRPFQTYKDLGHLVKWTANVTLAKQNFNDIVEHCSAFARANNHKVSYF